MKIRLCNYFGSISNDSSRQREICMARSEASIREQCEYRYKYRHRKGDHEAQGCAQAGFW
jgi:hypothetical protein